MVAQNLCQEELDKVSPPASHEMSKDVLRRIRIAQLVLESHESRILIAHASHIRRTAFARYGTASYKMSLPGTNKGYLQRQITHKYVLPNNTILDF